jgi:hypothetical protein
MLLLYCMAEASPDAPVPPRGVRGSSVEVTQHEGLACYFSRYEAFSGGTADELKQDALDFHWTVNHVFAKQTVVPFRFPTLVADDAAVAQFLTEYAAEYLADLSCLRDRVQMEVRFPAPTADAAAASSGASGTAYMKAKFDAAQKSIQLEARMKSAAAGAEWKQRANRFFALIPRGQEDDFRRRIAALEDATLRVSGPWPPSEFVNCYPDLPRPPQS